MIRTISIIYLLFTFLGSFNAFSYPQETCGNKQECLKGVNLQAATYKSNGTWKGQSPPESDAQLYNDLGFNIIRYGFSWDFLMPDIGIGFNATYLNILQKNVTFITETLGQNIILDFHNAGNFGQYKGENIGQAGSSISNDQFASMWLDLAKLFPSDKVILGLMNEPTEKFLPAELQQTLQTVITALRNANITNRIFVPSNDYQGISSWNKTADYTLALSGSGLIYDIHSYFDNAGGTKECSDFDQFREAYEATTDLLRQNGKVAFMSEIGGRATPQCVQTINDALSYLDVNSDVWLGWAAWGSELSQPNPRNSTDSGLSLAAFFSDCGDGDLLHMSFMKHGTDKSKLNVSSTMCTPVRDSLATAPSNLQPVQVITSLPTSVTSSISSATSSAHSTSISLTSAAGSSFSSSPVSSTASSTRDKTSSSEKSTKFSTITSIVLIFLAVIPATLYF